VLLRGSLFLKKGDILGKALRPLAIESSQGEWPEFYKASFMLT